MSQGSRNSLWPVRVSPEKGESLSSWFARLAHANCQPASDLYAALLPGARLYSLDLDRWCDPVLIDEMQGGTGVPAKAIADLCIGAYQGRVYEREDPKAPLQWLPHGGGTPNSFGQQACPTCLASETPFYRRSWRLSFETACQEHGTSLIDRCHECGAPIALLQSSSERQFCLCHRCGADLRNAPAASVEAVDREVQAFFNNAVSRGSVRLGRFGYVHSLVYFWILRKLCRLVVTGTFALPLRQHVLAETGWNVAPLAIPRLKHIDRLPPTSRRLALRFAQYLMADWPDRFVRACRIVGLSQRRLLRPEESPPFAFLAPVSEQLNEMPVQIDATQVGQAVAYLKSRDQEPSYDTVCNLLENRLHAKRHLTALKRRCQPYGTHRYWKLDGVAPETRDAAKRAARRAGENVGPWVDRAIRKVLERGF